MAQFAGTNEIDVDHHGQHGANSCQIDVRQHDFSERIRTDSLMVYAPTQSFMMADIRFAVIDISLPFIKISLSQEEYHPYNESIKLITYYHKKIQNSLSDNKTVDPLIWKAFTLCLPHVCLLY